MPALAEVAREKLQVLERTGRLRSLATSMREDGARVMRSGTSLLSFSCNDYLGLSHHPKVLEAAREALARFGAGAGASRLVTGNHPLYGELEAMLAARHGSEAALVFGSGYLANIGIIPALVGKGDLVLADKLVHACLLDGARLSGAKLIRFAHNDPQDCARMLAEQRGGFQHCLVVTDDVFSMDGDRAPLETLSALARQHDAWLMADGAHALAASHPPVDIYMGTLSKALGSYGGYVCGSRALIDLLTSSARSLMFSTALPPSAVGAALAALSILTHQPELAALPLAKAALFCETLGLPAPSSQIVPLVLGDEKRALAASAALEAEGYLATAIRPPTVPEGTSRLRFTVCAMHTDDDIARLAQIIRAQGWV